MDIFTSCCSRMWPR